MRGKTIHIVCLDAPAPPDYGGAIDMFYKVKALHEIGARLLLHYFAYRPGRNAEELKPFCQEVHAYSRKGFLSSPPLSHPFIVQSRINHELIRRLNQDQHPVLLEGLHCAGVVPFLNNSKRAIVRMHNEEAAYYQHLAKTEKKSLLRRLYFLQESRLLKKFQLQMSSNIHLACLSETDMSTFGSFYGFQQASFIPCFIPWQNNTSKEGKGDYCLYHGNLSVSENEEAALWLIEQIFEHIDVPFIIAGKGISKGLKKRGSYLPHVRFIADPSINEIDSLVANAHVNVLPSLNRTGVKLKLLNALCNGRFCLTNSAGVAGSRIQKGVTIADNAADWIAAISLLMTQSFRVADIKEREEVLSIYNNRENARRLSELWMHCQ